MFNNGPIQAFLATTALADRLRVKLVAGKLVAADAADLNAIGHLNEEAFVADDVVGVKGFGQGYSCEAVASEAITAGANVYFADGGKYAASGTVLGGVAQNDASGDGKVFTLIAGPNCSNVAGTLVAAPASATAAGTAGQLAYDATNFYVCVATNTWVRNTLATW